MEQFGIIGIVSKLHTEHVKQLISDIGIFARIITSDINGNLIKSHLLRAFTRDVFIANGLGLQIMPRQIVHSVARGSRVNHIAGKHGIHCPIIWLLVYRTDEVNLIVAEDMGVIF